MLCWSFQGKWWHGQQVPLSESSLLLPAVIPHRSATGTRLPDPRPSFTTSPPSPQQEEEQCFPNPTVPSLLDLPSRTPTPSLWTEAG